jgi:hypothetical protein
LDELLKLAEKGIGQVMKAQQKRPCDQMKKLVVATHNRDKFKEMKEGLGMGLGWEMLVRF